MRPNCYAQAGSTIIITLLFMCLLTIMATFAIETSMMQKDIVRNEREYRKYFYLAEAAAIEGMQRAENEHDHEKLRQKAGAYLNEGNPENIDYVDLEDRNNWLEGETSQKIFDPQSGDIEKDTMYALSDKGIAKGASLAMNRKDQLHDYTVYGLCEKGNSPILIKIGYRKRY